MATFEQQVESITGLSIDGSSNPTQTELSSFLVEGVIDVVNRMIQIRPEELSKFTKTTHDTNAVVKKGKILSVVREHDSTAVLRKCERINPADRYITTDSNSLLYKSKYNPGFYELNGSIYTVPAAGSSNNDIIVTQVHYDTGLVYGDNYNAGAIENFPTDYENLVVIYASIQSLQAAMGDMSGNLDSTITTANAAIATQLGNAVAGIGDVRTYLAQANTRIATAKGEIDLAKTEAAEIATQTDGSSDIATALTAINTELDKVDEVIVQASEEFDEVSTQTSGSGDSPIKNAQDMAIAKLAISDLTITAVPPDVPTLTTQSIALISAPTYTSPTTTISGVAWATEYPSQATAVTTALAASSTAIGNMSAEITLAKTEIADMENAIDKFRADGDDPALFGDESTYATSNSAMTKWKTQFDYAKNALTGNHPDATYDAMANLADIDAALNDEDIELAAGRAQQLQSTIAYCQQELNVARASIEEWNATTQTLSAEIQGFATAAQGSIANASSYNQQASGYIQEVNSRLSLASPKVSEFQAKVSDALNTFNDANVEYQANIQKDIQNAQLADANEAKKLQRYATELQEYQAEVNAQVQEYQQNLAQKQQEFSSEIQLHNTFIQEAQTTISSGNSYIQEAQAIIGQAQGYAAEVNARVAFTGAKGQAVQAYISTANAYLAEVAQDLNLASGYNNSAQTYIGVAQGYAAEVTSRLQVNSTKYQWYQEQINRLKRSYDLGFGIAPSRQEGQK